MRGSSNSTQFLLTAALTRLRISSERIAPSVSSRVGATRMASVVVVCRRDVRETRLMKPTRPAVMTPPGRSHVLCITSCYRLPSERRCHHASFQRPHAKTRGETGEGDGGDGGDGGGVISADAAIFFALPPQTDSLRGRKKKEVLVVRGAQPILAIPLLMQCFGFFLFCFLSLERLPCIMHLKFMGSIIVYWPWEA